MAVSSRFPSQPAARGLLRRTPQRILPVERTPRRLALVVTAVSGGPVPGGSVRAGPLK
ncbi:HD domain containing protein [Zea mays]|uniref:HD domain containing protein n=1 Tax=Zea mays TaxID=4577 RepID=A0A1D6NHN8_MAIZE|nr:HD domain containing protein [Zea mays]